MIIRLSGVLLVFPMTAIQAAEIANRFSLEVEPAFAWQGRNDVQIPNDATGTRFSIADTVGSGPVPAARVDFTCHVILLLLEIHINKKSFWGRYIELNKQIEIYKI
jgi:hypothetical protein